ncbi:MAG TPA: ABC transporter substrate-binding protein [Acidimicrobiia bacterium]|nr:ABC transporter substrate-binding protein [Acidimicrobiia bacterium]
MATVVALTAATAAGCGSRVGRDGLAASGGSLSFSAAERPAAGAGVTVPAGAGASGPAQAALAVAPGGAGPGGAAGGGNPSPGTAPAAAAARSSLKVSAGTGSAAGAGGGLPAAGAASATPGTGAGPAGAPAGSAPAAKAGTPAARAPIVFGTFGTGSGVIGRAVQPIITADKAWSADVNARGGLAGHPVKLIFGDDGGDPAAALAIAKRMVEQDKVVAFIGTYLVTTTPAVTPYLEQAGVPMVGGPGGNEIEDHSPMVFNPQIGSDEALGHGIHLAVTSQTDKRKMAILYCREASSCKQQRDRALQFAPLYGMTIVYEAQVSIAQPDFTAEVISARNAGAEIVTMLTDEQTIVRVARSAHRQGWNPVVTGTYTANAEVMQQPDAEGVLGIAATVPYRSSPKMQPYLDAVARYVPDGALGGYGATAWVQDKLIERLSAGFADRNPTTADYLEALYALKGETIGGLVPPITFNKGPHPHVNMCGYPIKVVNAKLTAPLGESYVCAKGYER